MSTSTRSLPFTLLCASLLVGCTGMVRDPGTGTAIHAAYELPAERTSTTTLPPSVVSDALLPPIQLQLPGVDNRVKTEQRFDIKVRDIHARDFFLSLVEETPYSVAIDPQISGTLSLDLKNVSVAEVMDTVRSVHGYDYKILGQMIQVFPNTVHTRIFEVDYLAVKRTGQSRTTSRSSQITGSSGGRSSTGGTGGTGEQDNQHSSSITTDSEVDFWSELQTTLQILVGKDEGHSVAIHPHTGMVMVRATPSELRVVEQYLRSSQLTLKRQVILEARILEVTLNDRFQTGINWSGLYQSGGRHLLGSQIGGNSIFSQGVSSTAGEQGIVNPSQALAGISNAFGGMFSLAVATDDFLAFIELLKTQGDVQVLSSPRVSTINNQKAVIKVGSDEFYVTGIDTDISSTAGTGATNVSVNLESFFSGVALDVTPQISEQGDVVLHIHPSVSDVKEQTKTIITTLGNLILPLAASNVRESDTVIRAANGQVVVIGGLMQNVTQDQQSSVPILGDIPLFGHLFRHTKQITRKSELVILLKPTVVDENGQVWQDELGRSSDAIRGMSM